MASAERWTDETEALVALATGAHHLDPDWTDADRHSRCICGGWTEGEMEPGWDDHMAEVVLATLVDAGLLLPPGSLLTAVRDDTKGTSDGEH